MSDVGPIHKIPSILTVSANAESNDSDPLRHALDRGITNLFNQQHPESYWWYTLEANDSINAEYIMLLHYLGLQNAETERAIARWILKNQNQDGSWSLYQGGPGDLSSTVECYFALKLVGIDIMSPPMQRAQEFIIKRGGITEIRIFTRIHLALFGLVSWDDCPKMPIMFMALPNWSPVNIYEFSSWARACVVPLLVIMDQKKACISPCNIDELYLNGDPTQAKWTYSGHDFLSMEQLFIHMDKLLGVVDKLGLKPQRKRALKKCEKYIRDHIQKTVDIYPAMFYGILALHSLGYPLDDEQISQALNGLKSFHVQMPADVHDLVALPFLTKTATDSVQARSKNTSRKALKNTSEHMIYQQCCISPVWDTAWAGVALLEAGVQSTDPRILDTCKWLIGKQITECRGDWAVKNPEALPGGWSFEFLNEFYPDIDDSIEVLTLLYHSATPYKELKRCFKLGVDWLLSMQSANGGFAAFDKDNNMKVLNKIPFSDHGACLDPPTVDVTGRMIEFLLTCCDMDPSSLVIQRAANFIHKRQERNGSFSGRWGVNYIYGTWSVLGGLCKLGRPKDEAAIHRSVRWLKSIQNQDGGYGESCESYKMGLYVPLGESVPSQTAWALMGLVYAGEADSSEAKKAADYLIQTQNAQGGWDEKQFAGTGFPGHFYIRYHGYRHYFPLMALGKYQAALAR